MVREENEVEVNEEREPLMNDFLMYKAAVNLREVENKINNLAVDLKTFLEPAEVAEAIYGVSYTIVETVQELIGFIMTGAKDYSDDSDLEV